MKANLASCMGSYKYIDRCTDIYTPAESAEGITAEVLVRGWEGDEDEFKGKKYQCRPSDINEHKTPNAKHASAGYPELHPLP